MLLAKGSAMQHPRPVCFIAHPLPDVSLSEANRYVIDQVAGHTDCRALLSIAPGDKPADTEAQRDEMCIAGFSFQGLPDAAQPNSPNSGIEYTIPEWAWEIAHRKRLVVTLNLDGNRALVNPANQSYIRNTCATYPNARLILAQPAHGFCVSDLVQSIWGLRGVENLYFDTSAICDSSAFHAILQVFGPSKLLYGSNFPLSERRAKCVGVGDGFIWINADSVSDRSLGLERLLPIGVDSVLALRDACRTARLNDADLERIFRDNARQLLGLESISGIAAAQSLYERAKQLIPGGTQLLSKRPEMYAPGQWPPYFREARGCEILDLEGREYCDMTTSGIGSCLLGYADPEVTDAVMRRVQLGSMCTLNAVEEVELGELLIRLHPWAEQVRYCRTGGESMSVAVRLARAATERDVIAFCGYHGWSDWYLAANLPAPGRNGDASSDRLAGHLLSGLSPAGVASGLGGTAIPFTFNQAEELHRIADQCGRRLAAVVMEPFRTTEPRSGFLNEVRAICTRLGAVLVFDEITSGWRFGLGGIHLQYGVEPDVAVYAKAISNGFPMGAILGRRSVMEAAQKSFISSTYWTEAIGPAAALATIHKMMRCDVAGHVAAIGSQMRTGLLEVASRHRIPLHIAGRDALLHISFDDVNASALGTLFTIRMLERGILAGSGFYPSLAHEARHIDRYLDAADGVFTEISTAIRQGDAANRLKGGVRHSGFAQLN